MTESNINTWLSAACLFTAWALVVLLVAKSPDGGASRRAAQLPPWTATAALFVHR